MDEAHLRVIRQSVSRFMARGAQRFDQPTARVLDVAPQDHEGAGAYFHQATVETLDIDPQSAATYILDLCQDNSSVIAEGTFDIVICTEVLEHVLDPFSAVAELRRMLKGGGYALITVPFNFRIHGPLPDCWRFTEHGLRRLFSGFNGLELEQIDTDGRFLMPVHYTLVAQKPS